MQIALAPVLAAAPGPDSTFVGNTVLVLVLVVGQVLGLIFSAVALYLSSRRHPPVAEEIAKNLAGFIPREEHDVEIQRVHTRIDKSGDDLNTARMQFAKAFGDLENAIGRLQGRLDQTQHLHRGQH